MLSPNDLAAALVQAQKDAAACGRWCRLGSEIDEERYHLWHNGIGGSDSSDQLVYQLTVLNLADAVLTARLKDWIVSLHARKSTDLNQAATAFAMSAD